MKKDGETLIFKRFQTVIFDSVMLSAPAFEPEVEQTVEVFEVIGHAEKVQDIYTAAGYALAFK